MVTNSIITMRVEERECAMGWGREESELGPLVHELEALLLLHLIPIDSISVVALKNEPMNYTPASPSLDFS